MLAALGSSLHSYLLGRSYKYTIFYCFRCPHDDFHSANCKALAAPGAGGEVDGGVERTVAHFHFDDTLLDYGVHIHATGTDGVQTILNTVKA